MLSVIGVLVFLTVIAVVTFFFGKKIFSVITSKVKSVSGTNG